MQKSKKGIKTEANSLAAILKLYLDDKTRVKAAKQATKDIKSLEMLVQFETVLALHKRQTGGVPKLNHGTSKEATYQLEIHEVAEIAEKFFSIEEPQDIEKFLAKNNKWHKLKASQADFSLFQDILSFYFIWFEKPLLKTPAYLKQIVKNRLYAPSPAQSENSIVIRLENGLRLIAGQIKNLYDLTNADAMVQVRTGVSTDTPTTGALQFLTSDPQMGEVVYHVVKDGKDTVMLTVKLQNYRPRPQFINLRRDGRLLQSLPLRDDFAWFAQLAMGDYEIELTSNGIGVGKKIDIHIV
ncbi:MAG: hypothetical protein LDLANPLL_00295 [Turneriella sp.]|nr:hypothetical protein [Turneriella sp.]